MRRNAEMTAFYRVPYSLAGKPDEPFGAFELSLDFAEAFELHPEHVRLLRRNAAESSAGGWQRLLCQTLQQATNRPTQRRAQLSADLLRGVA